MERQHRIGELMENTKGFIFTIDAAFALIVAGAAIGILTYAHFAGPSGFQVTTSTAYSVAQSLVQTTLSAAAQSSVYALAAANATLGARVSWQSFANGGNLSAFSTIGPQLPQLLFQFTANAPVSSPVSVGYGMAVFSAGNVLYAVNASTGNVILSKAVSGNVLYPMLYNNMIIYGNSTGYVTAVQRSNALVWNTTKLPAAPTTPLSLGGGYILFGALANIVLVSPLNGSIVYNALPNNAMTPSYSSGEFIASTSSPGSQNYLSAFALYGGVLQQVWSYQLSSGGTTSPLVYGNVIVVGTGNQIVGLNMGGGSLWSVPFTGVSVFGGGAASSGYAYFPMISDIWAINISCGCKASSYPIVNTFLNITPSVTPSMLYTVAGNSNFVSYLLSRNSSPLWNITLPAGVSGPYEDVALAYGNAYISGGSTVYAFGSCRALPSGSLLQAMASMYLKGQGGCATALLNSSFRSSHTGIFINGTYAPSLHLPYFNGKNAAAYAPSIKNPSVSYSVSMWFDANDTAPIMDIYEPTANNGIGGGQSLDYGGGWVVGPGGSVSRFNWTERGQSCSTPFNSVSAGKWHNAVVVVTGYANTVVYMDGSNSMACSLSVSNPSATSLGLSIGANPVSGLTFGNVIVSDVQVYSGMLNASQVQSIYLAGAAGAPIPSTSTTSLTSWYPLQGDTNDYGGFGRLAYQYNVTYVKGQIAPPSLSGAAQISAASFPMSLGGANALYNVSVVVWR